MTIIKALFIYPIFSLLYKLNSDHYKIYEDGIAWCKWKHYNFSIWNLCILFIHYKEFRSLFYYRIGPSRILLQIFFPGTINLYITTSRQHIEGGLIIQHGFSTIISANKIGKNCKIYQQVTIGYNHALQAPIIGNNVEVCCGAKIIGGVTIGNNVIIGANAVIVKDVPDNCIVAGVPGKIIKRLI